MNIVQSAKSRVAKFLAKHTKKGAPGWSYADAPDVRQTSKVQHPMSAILWALELGLTSNQPTLRDVEYMTKQLDGFAKNLIPEPISDTTLDTEAQRLDCNYLHNHLIHRIRGFHRSKMLEPAGLPCGVITVDGKNLATLCHDADGSGHARSKQNEKWHAKKHADNRTEKSYYLMPALRATLTSAEAKLCVYQHTLPPGRGEASEFAQTLEGLQDAYGRSNMFQIVDGDAGLTSFKNANVVVEKGYDYVFGLKGNQRELFDEAQALLLPLTQTQKPEMETSWESRDGKRIRRRLWRVPDLAGLENSVGKWTHLRQTWLVRQETRGRNGIIQYENRFFVTSLTWDFLTPVQILLLVRNHWGVEVTFNNLDLQWREDAGPWCTQGSAIWALAILRLMAYNTAQLLRRRRLRQKRPDGTNKEPISWRVLFKTIERSFELSFAEMSIPTA